MSSPTPPAVKLHATATAVVGQMTVPDPSKGWQSNAVSWSGYLQDTTAPHERQVAGALASGRQLTQDEWRAEWYLWGCRVRRDILIIEQYLRSKEPAGTVLPFIGDPGDPPPPWLG